MTNRIINAESIISSLKKAPAIVVFGPNQSGKTTLAGIIAACRKNVRYLNLEDPEDAFRLSDPLHFLEQRADQLIILDGIQQKPELLPVVYSMMEQDTRPGRFVLLGSLQPEAPETAADATASRVLYQEIHPLLYREVRGKANWQTLWLRGGFPGSLLAKSDAKSLAWRSAYLNTYLERGLPVLKLGTGVLSMRRVLYLVAQAHGSLVNYSAMANALGTTIPTLQRALDVLERTLIIRRLQPWQADMGKRLVKTPRIFIRDAGLLHALAGIADLDRLEGFLGKGASWAGFVVQQVIGTLKPSVEAFFYRTQDGSELDLVLVKKGRPCVGIVIQYSNEPRISRGMTLAAQALGNLPVLAVTPSAGKSVAHDELITVTDFERMWGHLKPYVRVLSRNQRVAAAGAKKKR